jgi:hypothetical protein
MSVKAGIDTGCPLVGLACVFHASTYRAEAVRVHPRRFTDFFWRGRLPEGFEHLDLAFRPLYPVELRETIGPRHYRQNGTVENPQPSRLAPPF